MSEYNHQKIEKKWQKIWEKSGIYKTKEIKNKPKYYILDMFPYPSGEGLHVGHPRGYIATDVYSRYRRMKGFNVLHPMGWDAFGLPAENYAIKHKIHPKKAVDKNITTYKRQLKAIGFDYDWSREINTTDPNYYKWTQWIFLQFFKKGLAFQSFEPINWCPSCKTGLALEDLDGNLCERCGTAVEKKPMRQWVLKITAYAEKLLEDLKLLDWPNSIIEQQKNWIGKSEGSTIKFKVQSSKFKVNEKIKFVPKLISLILSKEKYITYRLKPKNIKVGDICEFLNSQTGEEFALAKIIKIEKKKIKNISETQEGHEKFKNRREFYQTYENYYKIKVDDNTDVWLYYFELIQEHIEVFTTRLDTIFGCTYLVVAPEHPLLGNSEKGLENSIKNYEEVKKYIEQAEKKSEIQRTDLAKEKTGIELKGVKAINPFNNEEVPVFAADYVLASYGTGAVMAVPAHDQRDFEFAQKYNLPVKMVVCPNYPAPVCPVLDSAHINDGHLVNSGEYSGLTSFEAREKMADWLKKNKMGGKTIKYRLQDWVFSRQRYWGEPIPLIHCDPSAGGCGVVAVPEKDLPVKLPSVKFYEPTGTGESPLANITKWVNVKCPKCGGSAKRETNTMPQWAGSSWYYLAYIMRGISNFQFPISKYKKVFKHWLPVNFYVGGAEHATRHLIYARFWHKFLYDIGVVPIKEPFHKLANQGLILAEDGKKMSKRWDNVINPDDIIEKYGADTLRVYEMFMGPFEQAINWSTDSMIGSRRFLERTYRFYRDTNIQIHANDTNDTNQKLNRLLHQTIKKVTEDIENFKFNTAISQLMILLNEMEHANSAPSPKSSGNANAPTRIEYFEIFLKLLSPFAPHIAEELWQEIKAAKGKKQATKNFKSIHQESWPKYDKELIKEEIFWLPVQINGKVRAEIEIEADWKEEKVKEAALANEAVKKWINGKEVKKFIYIKNKIINIVI